MDGVVQELGDLLRIGDSKPHQGEYPHLGSKLSRLGIDHTLREKRGVFLDERRENPDEALVEGLVHAFPLLVDLGHLRNILQVLILAGSYLLADGLV